MFAAEVVIDEENRLHRRVVVQRLAVSVRQSRESTELHSDRQIGSPQPRGVGVVDRGGVGGAMLSIRNAADRLCRADENAV